MTPPPPALDLGDHVLEPLLSGALWWPAQETLVVADLHLEKGSRFAARDGVFLPPYDTGQTLAALGNLISELDARRVISLGDSFDDPAAGTRLSEADTASLTHLTGAVDWIWICGNHDPEPPSHVGGTIRKNLEQDGLAFRHEADPAETASFEISGHFHPKASLRTRARRISGPCFVADARRAILPAFGVYTGGLNVLDPAIDGLFPGGFDVHLIGRTRVHSYPRAALAA